MDILLPLLFMAIVYVVPKLWEKLWKIFKSKIGNDINLQENGLPGRRETAFVNNEIPINMSSSATEYQLQSGLESVPATITAASTSALSEEKVPWSNKMDANAVINGVIFAEIVQPPRAYRPFARRK